MGSTQTSGLKWIVTHVGSRQHYAVPRAFHARGHLEQFYTDFWCGAAGGLLRKLPGPLAALGTRWNADLPAEKVTAFNAWHLRDRLGEALRPTTSSIQQFENYLRLGKEFSHRVCQELDRRALDPAWSAAFLFNTGALEVAQYMRQRKIPVIVDQIDPARVEDRLVRREVEKWPGWQATGGDIPESYFHRLSREWEAADLVLVNSNWTRAALVEQGVDEKKIIVVPICFEQAGTSPLPKPARENRSPLRVLWLGQVILRKGIQYLFEAARKLEGSGIEFVVVGPVGISKEKAAGAPSNVSIVGSVIKEKAVEYYRAADVFVLPTISDGFAITQLEAMSHGLPVVTTPNCGEVVSDGVDGLIIPPGDGPALAEALLRLDRDRELLLEMSERAFFKPREKRFTPDGYADAVESAMATLVRASNTS